MSSFKQLYNVIIAQPDISHYYNLNTGELDPESLSGSGGYLLILPFINRTFEEFRSILKTYLNHSYIFDKIVEEDAWIRAYVVGDELRLELLFSSDALYDFDKMTVVDIYVPFINEFPGLVKELRRNRTYEDREPNIDDFFINSGAFEEILNEFIRSSHPDDNIPKLKRIRGTVSALDATYIRIIN